MVKSKSIDNYKIPGNQAIDILANIGDAIICVDNNNIITYWNKKAEKLYNLKADEVIGKNLKSAYQYKWINPGDKKAAEDSLNKEGRWEGKNIHIKKNGQKITVQSTVTILKEGENRVGLLAVIRNITAQKRLEEELEKNLEELESLMEIVPVAIWISRDSKCKNIIGNKMANEFYEAINGENVSAGPKKGDIVQDRKFFKKGKKLESYQLPMQLSAAKNKQILNTELEVILPSGKKRFIWGNARPLRDKEGNARGSIAAFMDTTERKKNLEEIKRLNKELRRRAKELELSCKELQTFNLSLSHDISMPLRSISGYAQMILDNSEKKLGKTDIDYLNKIRDSIEKVVSLINDLKKLSRISIDKLKFEAIDLSQIVESVAEDLKRNDKNRDVEFIIKPGLKARGDSNLIELMIKNILENSWKFTAKSLKTKIEFGSAKINGQQIFFISDNGIGINKSGLKEIFMPFRRAHKDKNYSGSGIGLSIVDRIISRHGGRIWPESKPGKGTTFYFTLND